MPDGQMNTANAASIAGAADEALAVAKQAEASQLISQEVLDKLEWFVFVDAHDQAQAALTKALADGGAAQRALDTIAPLFREGDVVELRALDPAGGGARSINGRLSDPAQRSQLEQFIREYLGRRNLYFGVNPRHADMAGTSKPAKADSITARRTVFLDFDGKDAPAQDPDWSKTRAELAKLDPVLILDSGNGFHAYFAVDELTGGELKTSVQPLGDMMKRLGSDPVADLPRIARLPWTVNLPDKTKRARGAVPVLAQPDRGNAAKTAAPRPLDGLCAALTGVAKGLGLPGAERTSAPPNAPSTGTGTGAWPAPSPDILRMVLDELPNDPNAPFQDRGGDSGWMKVCHALKHSAALAGISEDEAFGMWMDWNKKFQGDEHENERAFKTANDSKSGFGTLMELLERYNRPGHAKVKEAMAQAGFPQLPRGFKLTPVAPFNIAGLPPRRWLYGRSYIGGYVSMVVAPGGTGKSAFTMTEVVAMAAGKALLPGDEPHHPLRVWYHNAEDPQEEQDRRLAAALRHHQVTWADLGGRLTLTGSDLGAQLTPTGEGDKLLLLAKEGQDGAVVNREAIEFFVDRITDEQIEVLILDPLREMHGVEENSNTAANLVIRALREIANRTKAAIGVVHHTAKAAAQNMDAAGAGAARGASAWVDGARIVRQLRQMGPAEKSLGIPEDDRKKYVRLDNGKANLAPVAKARWFKLVEVPLRNPSPEYPEGDFVQTVEVWEPPKGRSGITAEEAQRVHAAVTGTPLSERRKYELAEGWVGHRIAQELGLDLGPRSRKKSEAGLTPEQAANRQTVRTVIAAGLEEGWLVEVSAQTSQRKPAPHIEAGQALPEPEPEPETDAD